MVSTCVKNRATPFWRPLSELLSDEKLAQIVPLVHERMEKLDDFISQTAFFFVGDLSYDEAAMKAMVPKKRTAKDARANLEALVEKIDTLGELTTESAKASLDAVMEENGLGPRDITPDSDCRYGYKGFATAF